MEPNQAVRPSATVLIEPTGSRADLRRDYSIIVSIAMGAGAPKYADTAIVTTVARRALEAFAPADGSPDRRTYGAQSVQKRVGKDATPTTIIVAVEGRAFRAGHPSTSEIDQVRAVLVEEGYRVTTHERRVCAEDGCMTDKLIEWSRAAEVPSSWYSDLICGRHDYRSCSACHSLYVLSSISSEGQAPSVHCEVCGGILVEWGSSKLWEAKLVKAGTPLAARDAVS